MINPTVELSAGRDIEFFDADSTPYGKTYGQWTVRWWQWALSSPMENNPVADPTGTYASINQPASDVWFLAGKFGSFDKVIPKRKCMIPSNRSILFPILNCEANKLEYPGLKSDQDLITHVSRDVDSVVMKDCLLDDISIKPERVASDPQIFEITMRKNNPFRPDKYGRVKTAADGYWIFLKRLGRGIHTLKFKGSCENGALFAGAEYLLIIE